MAGSLRAKRSRADHNRIRCCWLDGLLARTSRRAVAVGAPFSVLRDVAGSEVPWVGGAAPCRENALHAGGVVVVASQLSWRGFRGAKALMTNLGATSSSCRCLVARRVEVVVGPARQVVSQRTWRQTAPGRPRPVPWEAARTAGFEASAADPNSASPVAASPLSREPRMPWDPRGAGHSAAGKNCCLPLSSKPALD